MHTVEGWDELLHPRAPRGPGGGRFSSKAGHEQLMSEFPDAKVDRRGNRWTVHHLGNHSEHDTLPRLLRLADVHGATIHMQAQVPERWLTGHGFTHNGRGWVRRPQHVAGGRKPTMASKAAQMLRLAEATTADAGGGGGAPRQYKRAKKGTSTGGQFAAVDGGGSPTVKKVAPKPVKVAAAKPRTSLDEAAHRTYADFGTLSQKTPVGDPRVVDLQTLLHGLGYDITPGGQFGPKTEAAVRDLQAKLGVHQTGHVTSSLMKKLQSAAILSPCAKESTEPGHRTVEADEPNSGAMVALVPTREDAERLAVEDGLPADELHVTLVFLGEGADFDAEDRAAIVKAVREAVEDTDPVAAEAFAVSVFNPEGPKPCIVLGITGEPVAEVHDEVVDALSDVDYADQHEPYVAHLTLEYTDDVSKVEDYVDRTGPVTFDRVRIAFAGETTDIPLGGAVESVRTEAGTVVTGRRLTAVEMIRVAEGWEDQLRGKKGTSIGGQWVSMHAIAKLLGHEPKLTPHPHEMGRFRTAGGSHVSVRLPRRKPRLNDRVQDPRTGRLGTVQATFKAEDTRHFRPGETEPRAGQLHPESARVRWDDGQEEVRPLADLQHAGGSRDLPDPDRTYGLTAGAPPAKADRAEVGPPRTGPERLRDEVAAGRVSSDTGARLMRGETPVSIVDARSPEAFREKQRSLLTPADRAIVDGLPDKQRELYWLRRTAHQNHEAAIAGLGERAADIKSGTVFEPGGGVHVSRAAKVQAVADEVRGLRSESEVMAHLDEAGLSRPELDALGQRLGVDVSGAGGERAKAQRIAQHVAGAAQVGTPTKTAGTRAVRDLKPGDLVPSLDVRDDEPREVTHVSKGPRGDVIVHYKDPRFKTGTGSGAIRLPGDMEVGLASSTAAREVDVPFPFVANSPAAAKVSGSPAVRKMAAAKAPPKETPEAVRAKLDAVTSRDEAYAILQGKSVAELKQISPESAGIAKGKADLVDRIVMLHTGRQNFEAMHANRAQGVGFGEEFSPRNSPAVAKMAKAAPSGKLTKGSLSALTGPEIEQAVADRRISRAQAIAGLEANVNQVRGSLATRLGGESPQTLYEPDTGGPHIDQVRRAMRGQYEALQRDEATLARLRAAGPAPRKSAAQRMATPKAPSARVVRSDLIAAAPGERRALLRNLGLNQAEARRLAKDLGVPGTGRSTAEQAIERILSYFADAST